MPETSAKRFTVGLKEGESRSNQQESIVLQFPRKFNTTSGLNLINLRLNIMPFAIKIQIALILSLFISMYLGNSEYTHNLFILTWVNVIGTGLVELTKEPKL